MLRHEKGRVFITDKEGGRCVGPAKADEVVKALNQVWAEHGFKTDESLALAGAEFSESLGSPYLRGPGYPPHGCKVVDELMARRAQSNPS